MNEVYASVRTHTQMQNKIEGSRFIADIFPIVNEEQAKEHLEKIRKIFYDATHHCYAYTFGESRSFVRYSDDGEPSGTAGIKIFSAIQSNNLSDVLVIVTRYFGGTKLGVGGLGRAYFETADSALKNSEKIQKGIMQKIDIEFPFSETNSVMNFLSHKKYKILHTEYTADSCRLQVIAPPSQSDELMRQLNNVTRGKVTITLKEILTVSM